MNWGYRIVLGFVLFAAFVFTLVFKMITSGNDLVRPHNFKSGKQVNDELVIHQASADLEKNCSITIVEPQSQTIELQFTGQKDSLIGEIELICLSSDLADQKLALDLNLVEGVWKQSIKLSRFQMGNWLCEIKGNSGSKPFLIKTGFKI